jgi:hypothetical protein
MTVTRKRVKEILVEARQKINDNGAHWTQGRLTRKKKDGSHAYCAVGAIFATTTDRDERAAALRALVEKGLDETPRIYGNYSRNDFAGRTQIEAINDLRGYDFVRKMFNTTVRKLR